MNQTCDVAIIGAGPVGMMTAYYVGTRGLKPMLIDVLDYVGGQCSTLYPEKMIFDVAGQPGCTGLELVEVLAKQLANVECIKSFGTSIQSIKQIVLPDGSACWSLNSKAGDQFIARSIIIAIGKGAFQPRKLGVTGEDLQGVYYTVSKLDTFDNKRVLIVGGGDSAIDWCLALYPRAKSLIQIHRRSEYRAHGGTLQQAQSAAQAGHFEMLTFYELREIHGQDGRVTGATIFDNRSGQERLLDLDAVVLSTGFNPNLGNIVDWGLEIKDGKIIVDPHKGFATNLPGVFAVGDIAHFEGKVELIITGFGEAATSAYYAFKHIKGDVKGAAWCAKLPAAKAR